MKKQSRDRKSSSFLAIPRSSVPFLGVGMVAIVTGGLFAAAAASCASQLALWITAYTVLVVGAAQIILGLGAGLLASTQRSHQLMMAFVLFNIGNDAVLIGTILKGVFTQHALIVGAGGLLLFASMMLFLTIVHGAKRSWWLVGYRVVVAVILISIPIGLFLAQR